MQMYVNYFDRFVKTNIHAREYQLYLPSKDELQQKLLEWVAVPSS